jgi:transcription elongation factor Elf1
MVVPKCPGCGSTKGFEAVEIDEQLPEFYIICCSECGYVVSGGVHYNEVLNSINNYTSYLTSTSIRR